MTFDHKNSTFTRTGSFRQASITDRLQDPQECKPTGIFLSVVPYFNQELLTFISVTYHPCCQLNKMLGVSDSFDQIFAHQNITG